jgi:hypothetical protein
MKSAKKSPKKNDGLKKAVGAITPKVVNAPVITESNLLEMEFMAKNAIHVNAVAEMNDITPCDSETETIREIQVVEGNSPCYKTFSGCGLTHCLWFRKCQE